MCITPQVVANHFIQRFGEAPRWIVRSPGRVNLIGEHTDYNDGFVMPLAIDRAIWIAMRPRDDGRVIAHSVDFDRPDEFSLNGLSPDGERATGDSAWIEYIKGTAWSLHQSGLNLAGWEGVVAGDVPLGAGLSSSAALEMATARAFAVRADLAWDPAVMAKLGQKAENQWVGVNCGIMDQLVSAAGREGHALLIDCRSLETEPVPLPAGVAVVVLDTSTRRGLVDSAYNERRSQCESAAKFFQVAALRDVSLDTFQQLSSGLDDVTRRRALHVITENDRTLQAVEAMRRGEVAALGVLMNKSHESLRDDYEVSSDALNAMVEIAQAHPACHGARMTGAGFGGCAVALVDAEAAEACPGHSGAVAGRVGLGDFDHRVQGVARHLVVVAKAFVALVHQHAQGGHLAATHRLDGLKRAIVLGNHVQGPSPGDVVQAAGELLERVEADVAQGGYLEELGGRFTLRAALVVGRIDQPAAGRRVEYDDGHPGGQGDGLGLEAAAVDQQGVALAAGGRDQLVHDPAVDAHPLVLGLLAQLGHDGRVPGEIGPDGERPSRGHLERRRGGQPGAQGHVAGDHALPAGQIQARLVEAPRGPLDVLDPGRVAGGPLAVGRQAIEGELVGPIEVDRVGDHPAVVAWPHRDPDRPIDGQGHDEPVVVVGVFADEVDPAWGTDDPAGCLAESLDEVICDDLGSDAHGTTTWPEGGGAAESPRRSGHPTMVPLLPQPVKRGRGAEAGGQGVEARGQRAEVRGHFSP